MTSRRLEVLQRLVLVVAVLVLTPIGLSYAVAPARVLPELMDVTVDSIDEANTMRSVGGLVLAMVVLFAAGAMREALRMPALWALLAFTAGLSSARLVSITVDGMPSTVPLIYLALEFSTALTVATLLAIRPQT